MRAFPFISASFWNGLAAGMALMMGCTSSSHSVSSLTNNISPVTKAPVPGAPASVTAFVNVGVVPMDTERVLTAQTVVVERGWITVLGPSNKVRVPDGAVRIDGRSKYLIPGLADMHAHLVGDSARIENQLFLYLANGVTTVRRMDKVDANDIGLRMRAAAAAGVLWSPRLYVAGAWPGPAYQEEENWDNLKHFKPDSVATRVAAYKARGYDFIKSYYESPEIYDSIHAAARRLGIRVMGHVPGSATLDQALRWHQASIEHLTGYHRELLKVPSAMVPAIDFSKPPATDSASLAQQRQLIDFGKIPALAAATARAGVWNCPTMLMFEGISLEWASDTMHWGPELEYIAPEHHEAWRRGATAKKAGAGLRDYNNLVLSTAGGTIDARRQLIRAFQDAGAGVLLGTDHVMLWNAVPGVAVHRELQALVRAGLTPYQALVTGTRNVAVFFQTLDTTGTVAVGKRADLVLLQGNPLTGIQHTMQPAGVMLGGRWLTREAIARRVMALQGANTARANRNQGRWW